MISVLDFPRFYEVGKQRAFEARERLMMANHTEEPAL